jgi:hypothetical protein
LEKKVTRFFERVHLNKFKMLRAGAVRKLSDSPEAVVGIVGQLRAFSASHPIQVAQQQAFVNLFTA